MASQIDISNLDDASQHYGLSHSATTASTGGIERYLEEQRLAVEAEEQRRRDDRREVERAVRDHNLKGGEQWALPEEPGSVNEGAYEEIERRIRRLQAAGLTYYEASQTARKEFEAQRLQKEPDPCIGGDACGCARCNQVTEATLQPSIPIPPHGSRRGRNKSARTAGVDQQAIYDAALAR